MSPKRWSKPVAPSTSSFLFPVDGAVPLVMHGISTLAIALFLLVAGMEVDLGTVWRQGRAAFVVGIGGVSVSGFIIDLFHFWRVRRGRIAKDTSDE